MAVLALPPFLRQPLAPSAGPVPSLAALPVRLQSIINQVPPLEVNQAGILSVFDTDGSSLGAAPMMRTQWNLERSTRFERLDTTLPWAIVVHWFGNLPEHELDVSGYLRGFDGMRKSGEDVGRTSAHFLVGEGKVSPYVRSEAHKFGILQTQAPDVDGIPFAAAHLNGMRGRRAASDSYFVHALERLYHEQGNSPTILNHLSRSPSQDDWNYQTLAIELTGSHFDLPGHWPCDQQIA